MVRNMLKRGIYVLFVALGVLSVLISLYVSPLTGGILHFEGPSQLYFALFISSILTAIGLYAYKRSFLPALMGFGISIALLLIFITLFSLHPLVLFLFPLTLILVVVITIFKDFPHSFALRVVSITFAVALISFVTLLSWSACYYNSKVIYVKKMQLPESCIDLTDKLDDYPSIKEAISSAKSKVNVNFEELPKIDEISTNYTKAGDSFFYIKVGDNYYKVFLFKAVGVRKLNYVPKNYSKIDENDLKLYPSLEKIIDSIDSDVEDYGGLHYIAVSSEELYKMKELVSEKGHVIEFNGNYYEIHVEYSIHLEKIEYPFKCVKVSEEELSKYPTLKRAIYLANKNGKAMLTVPPEEWSRTLNFIREIRGCIEVNGSCYTFEFMMAD